jgi:hypothetical protein
MQQWQPAGVAPEIRHGNRKYRKTDFGGISTLVWYLFGDITRKPVDENV